MKVFTARQAIYNRRENVVAYELLFRDGVNNAFPAVSSESATAKLLLDSQFNQGIEKITGGKPALINYSEQSLIELIPSLLPSSKALVEILESVPPTDEVYEACRVLFHKGYKLVLDDFKYHPDWDPFLKLVRLIKFDLSDTTFEEIERTLPKLANYKALKVLAEKVETKEQYEKARELGFDFFQGYYFCKPHIVVQNDVTANRSIVMAMYQQTLKPNIDYTRLSDYFERDTSLAYKLLKFINSGIFPVKDPITSIKQALVYLGAVQVKKFVTLILTAHIAENKPEELTEMSIIRARFCENIARQVLPGMADDAFIVGIFSLLDAILDQPMEDLVTQLPITEDVSNALIGHENGLGNILRVVTAYESASWSAMRRACARFKMSQDALPSYYEEAISWATAYEHAVDSRL